MLQQVIFFQRAILSVQLKIMVDKFNALLQSIYFVNRLGERF